MTMPPLDGLSNNLKSITPSKLSGNAGGLFGSAADQQIDDALNGGGIGSGICDTIASIVGAADGSGGSLKDQIISRLDALGSDALAAANDLVDSVTGIAQSIADTISSEIDEIEKAMSEKSEVSFLKSIISNAQTALEDLSNRVIRELSNSIPPCQTAFAKNQTQKAKDDVKTAIVNTPPAPQTPTAQEKISPQTITHTKTKDKGDCGRKNLDKVHAKYKASMQAEFDGQNLPLLSDQRTKLRDDVYKNREEYNLAIKKYEQCKYGDLAMAEPPPPPKPPTS